jgi:hypothetical protein
MSDTCNGSGIPVDGPPDLLTGRCHVCGRLVAVADDDGRAMHHSAPPPVRRTHKNGNS